MQNNNEYLSFRKDLLQYRLKFITIMLILDHLVNETRHVQKRPYALDFILVVWGIYNKTIGIDNTGQAVFIYAYCFLVLFKFQPGKADTAHDALIIL